MVKSNQTNYWKWKLDQKNYTLQEVVYHLAHVHKDPNPVNHQ